MKTDILSPKALFQRDIRYTIPAFQRRYVWTLDDQWEPLWEDVSNTADDYLEKLDRSNGDGVEAEQETVRHFLGAVVVQQVNTATKDVERREVIDGQQRLTTLQLLLDAVQYVSEEHEIKGVAARLSKLVTNDESLVEDDDDVFKLWPTTNDREAFRHAMHNGLATDDYEDSLIVRAHEYFQSQARQWLGSNAEAIQVRAESLETAVTAMLQMVVIDLGPREDPHVIFETLNARGTPLLESDLIKNFVSSKSDQDDIWGDLDDNWWRQEIRQGRLGSDHELTHSWITGLRLRYRTTFPPAISSTYSGRNRLIVRSRMLCRKSKPTFPAIAVTRQVREGISKLYSTTGPASCRWVHLLRPS